MLAHTRRSFVLCCTFSLLLTGGILWHAIADEGDTSSQPSVTTALMATDKLGGDDRFRTFVSTDKPVYRPEETIYVRGVILRHQDHRPLAATAQTSALVEIKGPKGDNVASGFVTSAESVLGYSWEIPVEQAGGEYTIRVSYPGEGYPPAERKFDVRSYRAPRLKNQIKFLRDGYGEGDMVVATLETVRAEGGVPSGAPVKVVARVDGLVAYEGQTEVDEQGHCTVRFELPTEIERGEGTLALVIDDGGAVETASKTIPILLQTVDLTMYPEGGQLVAGVQNRVYFEAFTPAHRPADLAGVVVDADGNEIAQFHSEHEGRGRFAFTPQTGEQYALKITEPSGIDTRYPLPELHEAGVVLSSRGDVTASDEKIELTIASPTAARLSVTLAKHEAVIAEATVNAEAGKIHSMSLSAGNSDGVLVATVWDEAGKPLAERLVFRQPQRSLQVEITADADQYVPGGRATLKIRTTDGDGTPIGAVVGVTVTDDSVLEMIDRRDQAPRLPVMVLLEQEVQELADAHVYLDPDNPDAPRAVDLLLGTQGWRRFAFIDPARLVEEHGDAARRALALRMVSERMLYEGLQVASEARPDDFARWEFFKGLALPVDERFAAVDDDPNEPGEAADRVAEVEVAANNHDVAAEVPVQVDPARAANEPVNEPAARVEAKQLNRNQLRELDGRLRKRLKEFADLSQEEQELGAALDKAGAAADELIIGEQSLQSIRDDFVAVRVYAYQVSPDRQPGQRTDFTETLYWHAGVATDDVTGEATIEFGLNDSVTSFHVAADAFGSTGALAEATQRIESVKPFYLEPKLPLEVSAGDIIRVPIGFVNTTDADLMGTVIEVEADPTLSVDITQTIVNLAAHSGQRQLVTIRPGAEPGVARFTIRAEVGAYADSVTRTLHVQPRGFPAEAGFGGLLAPSGSVEHTITIPDALVHGSLNTRVLVYPTPLASMTEALERLIREPSGCFEQTSSTTYPLVMAQQYFMSHQSVDPSLVERSSKTLESGYNRLIGFESPSGGFEWFGSDPGHDALTAYGLLEFTDMAQVRYVDPEMLARTRDWLLAQRDGKGGYQRKTHTLHTWISDPECANAYNTWALLAAGVDADLTTEVNWVRDAAEKSLNTYAVALGANVLALAGDEEGANHLLDKLAGKQTADGSLEDATTSVIGSGGEALQIETTALAVTAWLTNSRYAANVEKSIQYLAESCKGGRYGSTQSTVLALRAIVAYDQSRAKPKAPGALQLVVDGSLVGEPVKFTEDTQGAIELPGCAELLSPGEHEIHVRMTGGSDMPYSIAVNYHTLTPNSQDECSLYLDTRLRDVQLDEGDISEAEVVVINRTGEAIPTPMAVIGIPGGLEVRHDQLKELVDEGRIAAYEVRGREVVLYWRSLKKEQRVELPLSVVAAVPGTYTGPASRAYLYYTDELKHWNTGLQVEISPK